MKLVFDIFDKFMLYLTHIEYLPIYTSCHILHNINKFYLYYNIKWDIKLLVQSDNIELIKHLYDIGAKGFNKNLVTFALIGGHSDTIKFLYDHRPEIWIGRYRDMMNYTIRYNDLKLFKILHKHTKGKYIKEALKFASYHGNLHIITYLIHNNKISNRCIMYAQDYAKLGREEHVFNFLLSCIK